MNQDIERDRAEALGRLNDAWNRGRLDAGEHERRTTALRNASTVDEVADAERGYFGQSAGTPGGPISPMPPMSPIEEHTPAATGQEVVRHRPRRGGLSPQTTTALQISAPTVATIAFFVCGFAFDGWAWAWLFWLLTPLAFTLLPGFTAESWDDEDEDED